MKVNETINLYGMDYVSRGHVKVADTALRLQGEIVENIGGGSFGDIFKMQIAKSLLDDHKNGDSLILKEYKNSLDTIKNKKAKFNFVENINITSSNYNVHHILRYAQVPTYSCYEVLFNDPVNIGKTYLVMDDLTKKDGTVFSLNNYNNSYNEAQKIFCNLSLMKKNSVIKSAKEQIDGIIKLSTGMDIKLHYDSLFFLLQGEKIKVIVGDFDNIETYVSRGDDGSIKPSAYHYYGNLVGEIRERNERVGKQAIKDFSDLVFGITEDMKEKLGAFFSS